MTLHEGPDPDNAEQIIYCTLQYTVYTIYTHYTVIYTLEVRNIVRLPNRIIYCTVHIHIQYTPYCIYIIHYTVIYTLEVRNSVRLSGGGKGRREEREEPGEGGRF